MNKLYLFLILLLTSCGLPYCHKVQLTSDDLKWINHFNVHDTIFYQSNYNERDTLFVTVKDICNPRNTFILDTEGVNWIEGAHEFHGFVNVEMNLRHKGQNFLIFLKIMRIKTDEPLKGGLIFCEKNWPDQSIKETSFMFKRKKYNNCILINSTKMEANLGDQPIIGVKDIVWNKDFGLLQYSLDDSSIYYIVK